MAVRVFQSSPVGNAVAIAWSSADLVGIVTCAGWRGPLRGFVLDAGAGMRLLASFPIANEPRTGHASIAFPEHEPEVVVTSDGRTSSRWAARTGAPLDQRELPVAAREYGLVGPLPDGDQVTVAAERITRSGPDGAVRWSVAEPRRINLLHTDPSALLLVSHTTRDVHVRDPSDGSLRATFAVASPCALGLTDDGRIWVAEHDGRIVWRNPEGALTRTLALDRLCMDVVIAPDRERALVLVDRLNLESEAQIVDLVDGSIRFQTKRSFAPVAAGRAAGTLWIAGSGGVVRIDERDGSLASIHGRPSAGLAVARSTGAAAFVSSLKLLFAERSDPKPRVVDRIHGEPLVAISDAGTHVFVIDERGARLIEVASGQREFTLTTERLEQWTIEPADRVAFDAAGQPHVEAGGHMYRVAADQAVPATLDPSPSPTVTPVVGLDEVISLVDRGGTTRLRVHLSPTGKAGIVEDGEAIDWLGPAAQAKKCRTVLIDGEVVGGKALESSRSEALYARALETA